jgi:stage III sporulation protein AA
VPVTCSSIERVTDDTGALLRYLPGDVAEVLRPKIDVIDEAKLRFGRPLMILAEGQWQLYNELVIDNDHLLDINAKVLGWRDDGRKGIEGTCHRLSRIRNADNTLEGVTVRIGRFLRGVAEPLRPYLEEDPSMLVLGTPGSGKSTLERDIARIIADKIKAFCMIVDTSAELSGDGRKAHPGIGWADRIQVSRKAQQADIIWEAVRNHNPRVLVVDEIGYAGDAEVIKQASKLGVKTIATGHGNTFKDVMTNTNLAPVIEPPIFKWLTIVVARGVYHVYDLPTSVKEFKSGQCLKYKELRTGGS